MSLPVYLSNIKSSGVYTFEFDKSQIVTTTTSTIRMIIGFSKVGPFNTPVFCQDYAFFQDVYGKRDKQLEKKGSYFHLSAQEMLLDSPIIALNLLILNDALDKTEFISFSTAAKDKNQKTGYAPLSGNFNSSKFWKLDSDKAQSNIEAQPGYTKSLLNFSNVGSKTFSVIVTQDRIQGLDTTANDWYGESDVPEFMDGSDYINDYCIRVNIIKGDYSDFEKLATDPLLGDYFDSNGIKKTYEDINGNTSDGLVAFLENPNVVSLGEYIGLLIPNFQDADGTDLYIQDLVNLETSFTGLFCSVDEDLFDGSTMLSGNVIDLLGGTIDGDTNLNKIDYLSYLGGITENLAYTAEVYTAGEETFQANVSANNSTTATALLKQTDTGVGYNSTQFDTIVIYNPGATASEAPVGTSPFTGATPAIKSAAWLAYANSIKPNVSFMSCTGTSTTLALVKSVSVLFDRVEILIHPKDEAGALMYFDGTSLSSSVDEAIKGNPSIGILTLDTTTTPNSYIITKTNDAGEDYLSGTISSGDDVLISGTTFDTFSIVSDVADGNGDALDTALGSDILSHQISFYRLTPATNTTESSLTIKSKAGAINASYTVTKVNDYEFTYTVGAAGAPALSKDLVVSDFLIRGFTVGSTKTNIDPRTGNTRFTRILSVKESGGTVTVKTLDPVYFGTTNNKIERYKSVSEFVTNYNVQGLDGFTMRADQMPDGTPARQNAILKVLTDTGLYGALSDKEAITFRYIVDTFDGLIEPSSKNVLTALCKNRQFAFAILNAPSVKALSDSTNPLFKFNILSEYDPRYVSTGGNQDLNPSNTFSLPSLNQGSNYCGFYHPYLVLREGPSTKLVPPAAYISNNFMAKYRSDKPYSIIAGPRRGVVAGNNVVGVEYIYDRTGLDSVEPFGLNVIVPNRGFGNVINANQTAQQNIKSALSSIHVRELLIYIEETVEQILKSYRWEFNTVQNRLEIKTLVDGFLSQILNDGGLYDYQTVMNTVNNTSEVIDNDMGIIDIAIEPVRGLGKLVQRVTILKTGAIALGEFSVQ
jgi:hypothetical protein